MKGLGRDQCLVTKHSIENMKRIYAVMLGVSLSVGAMAQGTLAFYANAGVMSSGDYALDELFAWIAEIVKK